ncbi:MAG: hypothetical protein ABSH45_15500 [Bryobacteraceae bacterium]|jgi:hypothetical protein
MSSPVLARAQTGAPEVELNDLIVSQNSVFGQLVAMCTFRDFHPLAVATATGSSAIESAALRLHQQILDGWLKLSLLEQKRDVATYLSHIDADPAALASLVARAQDLTPEGSTRAQRDLLVHNLAIVSLVLAHEWNAEQANRVRPIAASDAEESVAPPAKNVMAA